jgi:serine protease Do
MKAGRLRIFLYCLLAGVAGIAIGSRAYHNYTPPPPVTAAPSATVNSTVPGIQTSFAPIVEKDLPAVVNISSSKMVRNSGTVPTIFMDPFFRQFFGDDFGRQARPQKQTGLGSGVIVRADGYILTNNHVIDGATDIDVTLLDKRKFKAKVIGIDSKTDLGVLKIDAKDLPTLTLGDSSKVRVGDIALAMGQPFGLGQTVTMGIISAKGRNGLGIIEGYEDFIQTDAAINPGNSGGALVDARGDLIGINTAILTRNGGGNQGVGFAVPINLAHGAMDQMIAHGKVTRAYMGVDLQDLDPTMARALRMTDLRGVLVREVHPGTPAEKSGIQRGDVIREVNGERAEDLNSLRLRISSMTPGSSVQVKLLRDGAERTVAVKLIETPGQVARATPDAPADRGQSSNALDGVQVETLSPQDRQELRLPPSLQGVVLTGVAPGSPAADVGLQPGDVIQEVNRERITSAADFDRAIRRSQGRVLMLFVNRRNQTAYFTISPP